MNPLAEAFRATLEPVRLNDPSAALQRALSTVNDFALSERHDAVICALAGLIIDVATSSASDCADKAQAIVGMMRG